MRDGTALFDRWFSTSDAFQHAHAVLQRLKCRDVDQIRTGHSVLREQDRLAVALELRQQFRGVALEGCYELGTHEVMLSITTADANR